MDVADEDSTKKTTTMVAMAAATTSDDGSNDDNGGNDNDETTRPKHGLGKDGATLMQTGTMFGDGWGRLAARGEGSGGGDGGMALG